MPWPAAMPRTTLQLAQLVGGGVGHRDRKPGARSAARRTGGMTYRQRIHVVQLQCSQRQGSGHKKKPLPGGHSRQRLGQEGPRKWPSLSRWKKMRHQYSAASRGLATAPGDALGGSRTRR